MEYIAGDLNCTVKACLEFQGKHVEAQPMQALSTAQQVEPETLPKVSIQSLAGSVTEEDPMIKGGPRNLVNFQLTS